MREARVQTLETTRPKDDHVMSATGRPQAVTLQYRSMREAQGSIAQIGGRITPAQHAGGLSSSATRLSVRNCKQHNSAEGAGFNHTIPMNRCESHGVRTRAQLQAVENVRATEHALEGARCPQPSASLPACLLACKHASCACRCCLRRYTLGRAGVLRDRAAVRRAAQPYESELLGLRPTLGSSFGKKKI
eukprot:3357249-Amphidinium_carterae.3